MQQADSVRALLKCADDLPAQLTTALNAASDSHSSERKEPKQGNRDDKTKYSVTEEERVCIDEQGKQPAGTRVV